ncbi:MAG: diguanylate cyclase [Magnetococcales bacterium]|nr:diguanylate cyclase [Magnetococcales bacterium]MBF0115217.1 diguanylate cyclase [Magnetococcales bacterium]
MNGPKSTLLIVDDERFNLNVLTELLEPEYEILLAKSGRQALQRASSGMPPDLILLDVMMPEMDGFQVLQHLKLNPVTCEIPVIFVTAVNEVEAEARGLALGAVDYITKPISAPIVQARIRTHLSLRRGILREQALNSALQQLNSRLLERNEQLQMLNMTLKNLAMVDGLTGIANRRRFDDFVQQEWNRSRRGQEWMSMILMDIDYFKPFNDHYGHTAGDLCLKQVAQGLASALPRAADLIARYGGEEFVCVMPGTPGEGLIQVGNRLQAAVRALGLPHDHSKIAKHVTISLGGISLVPKEEWLVEDMIRRADEQLYRAKEAGRNRLMTSTVAVH